MPSNLLDIDSNFPTFTGEESEKEQIQALTNYLFQLRESLQYSLQNLTSDNFNAAALESLSEDAKGELGMQLQKIGNELNQLSAEVKSIEGRISGVDALSGQVETNKTAIANLEERMDPAEGGLVAVQEWSVQQEVLVDELVERVQNYEQELEDLETTTGDMKQKVEDLGDLVETLEGGLVEVQEWSEEQETLVNELAECVQNVEQQVEELASLIQKGEDDAVSIGAEGKDLHLKGNIYINGILFEQGGST